MYIHFPIFLTFSQITNFCNCFLRCNSFQPDGTVHLIALLLLFYSPVSNVRHSFKTFLFQQYFFRIKYIISSCLAEYQPRNKKTLRKHTTLINSFYLKKRFSKSSFFQSTRMTAIYPLDKIEEELVRKIMLAFPNLLDDSHKQTIYANRNTFVIYLFLYSTHLAV